MADDIPIIKIKCKECKEVKELGAYGYCKDCFESTDRHKTGRGDVERDADGTPLCRFCNRRVLPPRRTFCSDQCVHEWSVRSNVQYARAHVFLRDRGVCSICGIDTVALADELTQLRTSDEAEWRRQWAEMVSQGWDAARQLNMWDADHILPVTEGGGLCGLENLRTLCIPCHRAETRKLRARMAERNKQETQ